jgi:hypothetical protein
VVGALLSVWVATAHAQSPQLALTVAAPEVAVGQGVRVEVVLQGGDLRGLPRLQTPPQLPAAFADQTQTMSVVGRNVLRTISVSWDVSANEVGNHTLGPARATVDVGGREVELTSNVVQLRVVPRAGPDGDLPLSVTTELSPQEAWQGQTLLYTFGHRSRLPLVSARWVGHPEADLVVVPDARFEESRYTLRDGDAEIDVAFTRVPMRVTRAGTLRWEAPILRAEVAVGPGRGLFRLFPDSEQRIARGAPLEVTARALPPPPADFSGLIGDYTLDADISPRRGRVGQSLSWTLTLSGDGATDGLRWPEPPDLPGARVYPVGERSSAAVRDGRFLAAARLERSLVPTAEGTLTLPPTSLVVFSPTAGDYVTLSTRPVSVPVGAGEDGDVALQRFGDAAPEAEALALVPRASGPGRRLPWAALLPWVLGALALPSLLFQARRLATAAAAWREARRVAASSAQGPHHGAPRAPLPPPGAPERAAALDARLRAVAARLRPGATGLADLTLDPPDDAPPLHAALPKGLRERAAQVAAPLARARFGGGQLTPEEEAQAVTLLDALEALAEGDRR